MFKLRPKDQRGKTVTKWLDSSHTFSFGNYWDTHNMGFSDLRVINDDVIAPESGFDVHPHDNMEIISIIISGALEHKDSMGSGSIIQAGEVQKMTAGTGVLHSEFNPSLRESTHFLQIWILPDKRGLKPEYEQKSFRRDDMLDKFCLIVSKDGHGGSLKINQDAEIFQTILTVDRVVKYEIPQNRKLWIQIAAGAVEINNELLEAGDGLAVVGERGTIHIKGVDEESNLILFNLRE